MVSMSSTEQRELWGDKIRFMNTLKGGVIFCVENQAQAKICEIVGARALIALQPLAIDESGQPEPNIRMGDPNTIKSIMDCVMLPVFGQVRVGHDVEAHTMQFICANGALEYDKLPPASANGAYINKKIYRVPFICAASSLGEALQRISEGASMIHTRGGEGEDNGNVAHAVTELAEINKGIQDAVSKLSNEYELESYAMEIEAPINLLKQVAKLGRLPVPLFGFGGVVEPTDAAYLKSHGCDGLIIGADVLSTMDAHRRAQAMIFAMQNPKNFAMIAKLSATMGAGH